MLSILALRIRYLETRGAYSYVKAYGDVPPKWVTFSTKILRHGFHFGQKNPQKRVPFHKKSTIFEVENPSEMGPDLLKFRKKNSKISRFLGEKSSYMGRGFRPRAAHPVKN